MSPAQPEPVAVRLPPRARVVVGARPARHAHALRQLRRNLPDCPIDVLDVGEMAGAMSTLDLQTIDWLVLMVDSAAELLGTYTAAPRGMARGLEERIVTSG